MELARKLTDFGFKMSTHDHCLYVKGSMGKDFLAIVMYVSDLLITGMNKDDIIQLKKFLNDAFTIKDMWQARYFLRIELARTKKGMILTQSIYILDLLSYAKLNDSNTVPTPLSSEFKASHPSPLMQNPDQYMRLIGRFL